MADARIGHFVVLMLENRSFDHIFGYRKGVNGLKGTEFNLLDPSKPQGPINPQLKVSNAEPFAILAGEGPSHSFNAVTTQIYGAPQIPDVETQTNIGFVKSYRESLNQDHVSNPTSDQINASLLATVIKMFGLTGALTNRVKTASTFEALFSEAAPRTDTPETIESGVHIPTPRHSLLGQLPIMETLGSIPCSMRWSRESMH
jgi:hypothetical protein